MQQPVVIDLQEKVKLKCVQEGNRLRIKIVSKGWSPDANCQFPKNIRVAGREFLVPKADISIVFTKGKFFYKVRKNNIEICENGSVAVGAPDVDKNMRVFEDPELMECVVCMGDKDPVKGFMIFIVCGHCCTCEKCALKLTDCPMCRTKISQRITKLDLQ